MKGIENIECDIIGGTLIKNEMLLEKGITKISGIYKIINKVNGKYYIGSSMKILNRWDRHVRDLKYNRHHNDHLQRAWKKYGSDNFTFKIIEIYTGGDEHVLISKEQVHIDISDKNMCYNECMIAGKLIMTSTIKNKISLSNRGKVGMKGSANPMYGKKVPEIVKSKIRNSTSGSKNHFYGKKHSLESIEKMKLKIPRGSHHVNYDSTKYRFSNFKSNEMFTGTRNEFYTKYNLDSRCVKRLIKGNRKSYKGWIII